MHGDKHAFATAIRGRRRWRTVASAAAVAAALVAVAPAGDACGSAQVCHPLILHWSGTRWSKTASPMVADSDQLKYVTASAPSSAWATA